MFYGCSSLKSLPDISKWNISQKKLDDLSYMFYGCSSLKSIPDISTWDFSTVKYMNNMFEGCSSLKTIPNIPLLEKKITYGTEVTDIFKGCDSLEQKPDLIKSTKPPEDINTKNFQNNCFKIDSGFPFFNPMNFPNFTGLPLFPNTDLTKDNNMINNNFPGLDAFRSQYFNFMQNSNFQGAPPFPNQNLIYLKILKKNILQTYYS
jgi:surface protein